MNKVNTILIVGLGNPGKKYKNTPHNAGFEVVDELTDRIKNQELGIKEKSSKEAVVREADLAGRRIIFAKPMLFMNRSGEAVQRIITNYELRITNYDNIWVIYDDIDLPFGAIRVRTKGSSGGHRGVQNIIDTTGSEQFTRFRIGVLPPDMPGKRSPEIMNEYVTKKLKRKERKLLAKSVEQCAALVEQAIDNGLNTVLGDHNIT